MLGNSCEAQAAKMADPSNTLSSLSGTNTGTPVQNTPGVMFGEIYSASKYD